MARNIKARRKLSALYERGVEVRFGLGPDGLPVGRVADKSDESANVFVNRGRFVTQAGELLPLGEDEVQVWVQVPSSLHRDQAMRDAQAARALALVNAKRKEDSEEHLTVLAFLADMSDETLVEYVLLQNKDERRQDAIREVLGEDEWKDMTSYQDALREFDEQDLTMEELLANEEYQALLELDIKFGKQVSEREMEMMDGARDALVMELQASRARVERKAVAARADLMATQAFMAEYERKMLFYSVRDYDDPTQMFYESAREMADQDEEILRTFQRALAPFISDSAEAKNLQGVVSGSASSEPPNAPETSAASTPQAANA